MDWANDMNRVRGVARVSLAVVIAAGLGAVPTLPAFAEEPSVSEPASPQGSEMPDSGSSASVILVGGEGNKTFEDAVKSAASAGTETTIQLVANATVDKSIPLSGSTKIKLDLNGHKLQVKQLIVRGALSVVDSSSDSSGMIFGTSEANTSLVKVDGSFVLNGGTVKSERLRALQAGTQTASIEISGGKVVAPIPLAIHYSSTVKILGGELETTGDDGYAIDITASMAPSLAIGASGDYSSPVISGLIHIPGGKGNIQLIGGTINGVSGKLPAGGIYTSRFESNISGSLPAGSYCVQKDDHWVVTNKAPEGAVAAIAGETYNTLQAAIEATTVGNNEITLLTNVQENIVIGADKNVTLNLNGCRISSADSLDSGNGTITVQTGGKLTVNDSGGGSVDTTVNGTGALVNHGTVTINGGSFTRSEEGNDNTWYTVDNQGTMTFAGGSVTNDSQTSSLVRNLNGTLTITGGTFENERFTALKNDSGGTLNISGGTVRSTFGQCVQNWNKADISGGEFYGGAVATWSQPAGEQGGAAWGTTTISDDAVIYGDVEAYNYQNATKPAVVFITGGTVKGEIQKLVGNTASATPDLIGSSSSTITVSGGVFDHEVPAVLLLEGKKIAQTDEGQYVPVSDSAVALIGTTSYDTLGDAIAAAAKGSNKQAPENPTTITLLQDTSGGFDIGTSDGSEPQNIVLNLNGNTLTLGPAVGSTGTETNGLRVLAYSKLHIKNGTVTNNSNANDQGKRVVFLLVNYGEMKLTDVTVKPVDQAELGINNRGALTLEGKTKVSDGPAGLKLAITNDPYNYFYSDFDASLTVPAGSEVVVGCVQIERYGNQTNKGSVVLNIASGSFGELIEDGQSAVAVEGNITGGSFKSAPAAEYLADGFEVVENPDGSFGVKKEQPSTPGGGTGGGSVSKPDYAITVPEAEHGKVTVDPERAEAGEEVTVSAEPDEGFEVSSVTVTDKDGEEVEVEANPDGTWTFEMPKGGATVEVAFACDGGELCPTAHLADIDQTQWYHLAVDWAVTSGLMEGYEGTELFGTGDPLTRAQLAQMLYNRAGAPEVEAEEAFADVDADDWFAPAVAWASSEGLLTGYGDHAFGPDDALTREQLAVVFWRIAGEPAAEADLSRFPDGADTSAWAADAVEWAVSTGLLEGYTDTGRLDPAGDLTRAQAATVFFRQAEAAAE